MPSSSSKSEAFVWDKELSVRLQTLIRQAYKLKAIHLDDINWLWVARKIHPQATSRVCKNHWKFLFDRSASSAVVWHHEDVKRLEEGIRLLGPKKLTAIRDHFLPNMTKDDITRHWYKISDKATVIKEDEYYRLLEIVQDVRHGGDHKSETALPQDLTSAENSEEHSSTSVSIAEDVSWTEVARRMGAGWTKLPCKRVWESSFQNLVPLGTEINSSPSRPSTKLSWTNTEDNTLLRMVKFVGRDDWYSVAKALQSGKSAWQCRLRWCQILDPVDLKTENLTVQGELYLE